MVQVRAAKAACHSPKSLTTDALVRSLSIPRRSVVAGLSVLLAGGTQSGNPSDHLCTGTGEPDLDLCWRAYRRGFDKEHTFRFGRSTSAGPHRRCRRPTGSTAGLGWSSPPTPSCAWPAGSSTTNACPGNDPATPSNSPQRASAEGFDDSARPWAHQPVRRKRCSRACGR